MCLIAHCNVGIVCVLSNTGPEIKTISREAI
jgi:hypothetical protein